MMVIIDQRETQKATTTTTKTTKAEKKNKLGGSYSKMTTNFANIDRTTASSKCI